MLLSLVAMATVFFAGFISGLLRNVGVSINGGAQNGWCLMENPIKN
jgi:hypothetical protein